MIPKEIVFQLIQLKEKVKTYSSVQRSMDVSERRDEVDEIKEVVENVNIEIADLSKNVNNILVDGLISKFDIENWFEVLKDKSRFHEPNPREIYEEEQKELERQRKVAEEKARQEREEYQKKLKTKRIEEYKNLCYYGPDDFDKLQQLIKDGFDIKQDGKIYDLSTLIDLGRSLEFIEFPIEAGMKVNEDELQELERQRKIAEEKVKQKLEDIERQRQIEEEKTKKQLEEFKKKLKTNVIGSISVTCILIFGQFMPHILDREMDSFYYVFIGIITIPFLLMVIISIVELRKKPKITNTIHLHGNQLPHRKQTGYEIPNAQTIIGIAGSVKEFNHKEIKRKKLILWIVVTLISISIIALIYIFFEEIMGFFKILFIILLIPFLLPILLKKR